MNIIVKVHPIINASDVVPYLEVNRIGFIAQVCSPLPVSLRADWAASKSNAAILWGARDDTGLAKLTHSQVSCGPKLSLQNNPPATPLNTMFTTIRNILVASNPLVTIRVCMQRD